MEIVLLFFLKFFETTGMKCNCRYLFLKQNLHSPDAEMLKCKKCDHIQFFVGVKKCFNVLCDTIVFHKSILLRGFSFMMY